MHIFAGVQGLEPRLPGPEPGVLPLDDTPITLLKIISPARGKFTAGRLSLQPYFSGYSKANATLIEMLFANSDAVVFLPG